MNNFKCITWKNLLSLEKKKNYFLDLFIFLKKDRLLNIVYPENNLIFNAFFLTEFKDIKVVILGQDPYCYPFQAHGLSFSVLPGTSIPPTLRNIFKELEVDYNISTKKFHGCLASWATQGVFLLNSILTVSKGNPGSHAGKGWEIFTDTVISVINTFHKNIVFLLWGKVAQKKIRFINLKKHFVFFASHPSPFSANISFFGCKHFSKTNRILSKNKEKIDWFKNMNF